LAEDWPEGAAGCRRPSWRATCWRQIKSVISAAGLFVPIPSIENSSHYKPSSRYLASASIRPDEVLDRHQKMNGRYEGLFHARDLGRVHRSGWVGVRGSAGRFNISGSPDPPLHPLTLLEDRRSSRPTGMAAHAVSTDGTGTITGARTKVPTGGVTTTAMIATATTVTATATTTDND
jgi:hypothetical protein